VGDKIGYIDKTGSVVIRSQFDVGSSFSNGIARTAIGRYSTDRPGDQGAIGDKWGYIDKRGMYVWEPTK